MGWIVSIATIAVLTLVSKIAGDMIAAWLSSVLLAFCIGAFWGAGDQKRRVRPTPGSRGE